MSLEKESLDICSVGYCLELEFQLVQIIVYFLT